MKVHDFCAHIAAREKTTDTVAPFLRDTGRLSLTLVFSVGTRLTLGLDTVLTAAWTLRVSCPVGLRRSSEPAF